MQQQNLFNHDKGNPFKKNTPTKKIKWLSHSALEEMNRCPRCFWISYKLGIKLPEGIQSRLANRLDNILKKYFESYRQKNKLPPLVEGKIDGKLKTPFKETYFYPISDDYGFYGKLDECVVDNEGNHIPVDFKTASSDPRKKQILPAYQNQIDEYLFLMEANGLKVANFGYLIYFFPEMSMKLDQGFPVIIHIVKIERKEKDVIKRIKKAIDTLELPIPQPSDSCDYCRWFEKVKRYY